MSRLKLNTKKEATIVLDKEITRVDYINRGDGYKTAFTVKGQWGDITCIRWGYGCELHPGDRISMKGRYDEKAGVFLVWSLLILRKA